MTYTSIAALLLVSVFVTGCDTFTTKTPLKGHRETVVDTTQTVRATPAFAGQTVSVQGPSLPKNLTLKNKISLGKGKDDAHRVLCQPVVDATMIIGMDAYGTVSTFDRKTNKRLWCAETNPDDAEALGGGVAADDTAVYAANGAGNVTALDKKTGKLLWVQSVKNPCRAAPLVRGRLIYVSTIANEMHALNAQTGEIVWSHHGMIELTGVLGSATPTLIGDALITPYSSGEIFALNTSNGYPIWSETLPPQLGLDALSNISHIRARPTVYGGDIYLISHSGHLLALDGKTGQHKWRQEFAGIQQPLVTQQYVCVVTLSHELAVVDRQTGGVYWVSQLPVHEGNTTWAGPIAVNNQFVLGNNHGEIIFFSPETKKITNTIKENDNFSLPPFVENGMLMILGDSGTLYQYV